jgi:hypothetical protein
MLDRVSFGLRMSLGGANVSWSGSRGGVGGRGGRDSKRVDIKTSDGILLRWPGFQGIRRQTGCSFTWMVETAGAFKATQLSPRPCFTKQTESGTTKERKIAEKRTRQ